MEVPEFDQYASNYTGGNEDPLKRFFGQDQDQFVRVKVSWLLRYFLHSGTWPGVGLKLLDFGCGTGEFLNALADAGFTGELHGADVSSGMLCEAARRWQGKSTPVWTQITESALPYPEKQFDFIIATCVFHHIHPDAREAVFLDLNRVLKAGGKLVIFEHNPVNPMTRLIVKRAAIDRNAILLYPGEVVRNLQKATMKCERCEYILFVPPKLEWLSRVESWLRWLPMGAQYALVGEKRSDL